MLVPLAAPQAQTEQTKQAAETHKPEIEEIETIARQSSAHYPGARNILTAEDLQQFGHTDIERMLRRVPGVSLQLEDGFGLRPNISIRGVPSERSARVMLLEDNIPVAPAPYSAPSAYYFPTAGRLAGIEVIKGSAAILQGPNSTGGAINMLTPGIPHSQQGSVMLDLANHGGSRTLAQWGHHDRCRHRTFCGKPHACFKGFCGD